MTKQEILNYIFKSKDGASWNEVSEMLNELGLKTRTHHIDENGGFVSILIENGIRAEIREVNEFYADRTKYNGKTELLISWVSKLTDKTKS
jgi:hypothetical protein